MDLPAAKGRFAVAVFSICVIATLAAALAAHLGWVRARVHRLERESADLSRALAAVKAWAAKELTSIRGELAVSRVNESAARIKAHRAEKRAAAASPPEADDAEGQRDTVEMSAPATLAAALDDDDEATRVLDPRPPTCARRATAPLAHPDLIGSEDIADEVAFVHLGPEDKTPPRRGRAAVLVPAFHGPEEGSAA